MAAKQLDPDRLAYSVIERALAILFGADETAQRGWLRGRIQNLRKLGLAPPSPGAGRAIGYTQDDADKWLIAIEFGLLHVDPSTSISFIQEHWNDLEKVIEKARRSKHHETDVVLTMRINPVMSKTPEIWRTTIKGLDTVGHSLRDQLTGFSIFNLSALVRAFDRALVEAAKPNPPPPPETPDPTASAVVAAHRKQRGDT